MRFFFYYLLSIIKSVSNIQREFLKDYDYYRFNSSKSLSNNTKTLPSNKSLFISITFPLSPIKI